MNDLLKNKETLLSLPPDCIERIVSSRQEIAEYAVRHPLKKVLQKILDEICEITDSGIGFFHFIDATETNISLQAWSTQTLAHICPVDEKDRYYPVSEAGVWSECMRQRQPVIHNNSIVLPHRKGMPEGHAPITRELVVPIIRGTKIAGVLGVGNRRDVYCQEDVDIVVLFADLAWDIAEKVKAIEELSRRESRFRGFFNLNPSPTFVWEVDGKEIYLREVNDAALKMTEGNAASFIGLKLTDIYRDMPVMIDKFHECFRHRRALEFELEYENRYAKEVDWIHFRLAYLEPSTILLYADNLTEKKHLHATIQEKDDRFLQAMANTTEGFFDWDLGTGSIYLSPIWKEMLGYADADIENRYTAWQRIIKQTSRTALFRKIKDIRDGKLDSFKHICQMRHRQGHWIDVLVRARLLRDNGGRPIRVVGTHTDITDQRKKEYEIELLNTAIQNSLNAFDIVSEDGTFVYVNDAYVRMWGYDSAEEIVGTSSVSHCLNPQIPQEVVSRLKAEGRCEIEFTGRKKDGSLFEVLMSARLARDMEGREIYPSTALDITRRKKAEEELRRSHEVTLSLLNAASESIFLIDRDGVILEANEITAQRLGFSYEEVIGKCVYELLPEDIARERKRKVDNAFATGTVEEFVDKRGEIIFFHRLYPVVTPDNAQPYMAVFSSDVTREQEAINELRESESKFKSMFQEAPISYQSLDQDGNFLEVNETWLRVMGYTREEVMGKNFSEFLVPEWKAHFQQNFPKFKSVGEILGVEFTMLKKDGSPILVSFHGKISKTDDGTFERTHCVFNDVTRLRETEHLLQKELSLHKTVAAMSKQLLDESYELETISNLTLETIMSLSSSKSGFILSRGANIFRNIDPISDAIHDLFPASGTETHRVFPLDETRTYPGLWGHVLNTNEVLMTNEPKLHPSWSSQFDGKKSLANFLAVPVRIGHNIVGVLGVANREGEYDTFDLQVLNIIAELFALAVHKSEYEVQRDDMEKTLRRLQKHEAIGALAGGIAHDFNNILVPILGYAEMLEEDVGENPVLQDSVAQIISGATRAKELIRQILTFSRQYEEGIIPVKPHLIVREALKLIKATLPSSITIKQSISNECSNIIADPTQIHQVVMNLLTNAYHALSDHVGIIELELEDVDIEETLPSLDLIKGHYVLLTVRDNGIGMNDSMLEKIFDPYFSSKPKDQGTGLGLSVVLGIVKACNGEIEVKSRPGCGTEFKVYFPASGVSEIDGVSVDHESHYQGRETILLVDDELSILSMQKRMLERYGYNVKVFNDPADALDDIQRSPEKYSLVITDMAMPRMTGDLLLKAIKKVNPSLPVILCTGYSEIMTPEKAEAVGASALLTKPVSKNTFAKTVKGVLDQLR
ncbi:PAS domain S-box protein [Desulfopila sp. IMCC35008]|uniref:PAS domain S-box protein n=1 Tax=Desulfopila sp. IMCC35008 TaxID=2653858 RepID=UPI0013CFF905|nr:PAS domain S-box protein [Desulfopila sp. IMCC35008]